MQGGIMIACEYLKEIKTESEITVFKMAQEGITESNGMKIMETFRLTLSDILLAVLDDRLTSRGKWQNCCHLGNMTLEWKNT